MDQNLADKLKRQIYARKFTGYVLLGAISMVFVFFGLPGQQGGMGMGSAARVNDAVISVADFQYEETRIQNYYSQLFGGSIDLSSQRQDLRQRAMESLIQSELISQAAQKEGIAATDAEVRDRIINQEPAFQENGQFQRERYMYYMEATRTTPASFESKIRKDIETLRTRRLFEASARPMKLEMEKMKALKEHKLNIAFVQIDNEKAAAKLNVDDGEAQQKLADAGFAKRVQDHFNLFKSNYGSEEEVRAQHILVGFKMKDPESEKQAFQKIQQIRTRALKEDFGKLASQTSEDPGSKSKNGDLGFFGRGRMVKEFEDVAFKAPIGQVSEPVKSPFGYHIIKVTEKKAAKEPNFEESKMKIAKFLVAKEKIEAQTKVLEDAVSKGDEAGVENALRMMGLSWEETGYFELASDAIPRITSPQASEAVFEISEERPLLRRMLHEANGKFVLKYKGARVDAAPSEPSKADVMLQRQKADGMYTAWFNKVREEAKVDVNPQVLQ